MASKVNGPCAAGRWFSSQRVTLGTAMPGTSDEAGDGSGVAVDSDIETNGIQVVGLFATRRSP